MIDNSNIKSLEELEKLGLLELGRGKVISRKDLAATPGQFPVYSSAQLNNGVFGHYGNYEFDEEIITWSVDGGGSLFHRPKHKFSITNVGGYCRILKTDAINYEYLFYVLTYLHSTIKFDWVKKAHPSTLRKEYKSIPLPVLSEQIRIASILTNVFKIIEVAKANARQNQQNAKEFFESYLQNVFENNISGTQNSTLNEICELIVDCEHKTAPTQDTGYPSIRTPNIGQGVLILDGVNRVSEETYKEWTRRAVPKENDLILAREAPAGNIGVIPKNIKVCLGQRTVLIRPKKDKFISKYLAFLILSRKVQKQLLSHSTGATVQHINMKDIRAFKIYNLPTLVEQQKIINDIGKVLSETKKLETIYTKKIADLEEMKKSVLQKGFSGQINTLN